jgi:hypothetical protein
VPVRVVEQVQDRAPQRLDVDRGMVRQGVDLDRELDARALRPRGELRAEVVDPAGERGLLRAHLDRLPALDAREVEHVVDEPAQSSRFPPDRRVVPRDRVAADAPVLQVLRHQQDRGQGRPQLVADVRDERGAHLGERALPPQRAPGGDAGCHRERGHPEERSAQDPEPPARRARDGLGILVAQPKAERVARERRPVAEDRARGVVLAREVDVEAARERAVVRERGAQGVAEVLPRERLAARAGARLAMPGEERAVDVARVPRVVVRPRGERPEVGGERLGPGRRQVLVELAPSADRLQAIAQGLLRRHEPQRERLGLEALALVRQSERSSPPLLDRAPTELLAIGIVEVRRRRERAEEQVRDSVARLGAFELVLGETDLIAHDVLRSGSTGELDRAQSAFRALAGRQLLPEQLAQDVERGGRIVGLEALGLAQQRVERRRRSIPRGSDLARGGARDRRGPDVVPGELAADRARVLGGGPQDAVPLLDDRVGDATGELGDPRASGERRVGERRERRSGEQNGRDEADREHGVLARASGVAFRGRHQVRGRA